MNNELRATTKIKAGEEITVSYVYLKTTRNERRLKLKLGWFFECQCVRCRNNDDDKVLEMNNYYDFASNSQPNDAFKPLLKYCDLINQVLGEFCSESAVPLVNLYSIAFLCRKDKEELDRIYKRAEEVVLVTYGQDYPLFEYLERCKSTPSANKMPEHMMPDFMDFLGLKSK